MTDCGVPCIEVGFSSDLPPFLGPANYVVCCRKR